MSYVILGFLWIALLLYLLTGGADYGVGILEFFSSREEKKQIRTDGYHAIGPVWEANHMWLIIAVVIMFVGFPQIYTVVSIYLHIPLVFLLLGIIARGTAFTFRNYDAVKDNSQRFYSRIYVSSSFITPFFLGVIAGSAVSGRIEPGALDFLDTYVYDWLNYFSIAVGLFTMSLCGFIAAVYLLSESTNSYSKAVYMRKIKFMTLLGIISLSLIFGSAAYQGIPVVTWLFGNAVSFGAVCLSTVCFLLLGLGLKVKGPMSIRLITGMAVTLLYLSITYGHFPDLIILKTGTLSLLKTDVPKATLNALGTALITGSVLILPSLFLLMYSFNMKDSKDFASGPPQL